MNEAELVRRAIDGDQQCLHILLETHYKTVYGFLIKMTGDLDLAQDLVQETLLKASLNISKFRGDCKFSTYLIQIALNLYRNEMRRNKRVTVMSDDILEQQLTSVTPMDSSLEFLEAMKVLQEMSEEHRVSFILKHYYGYSIEEISKHFNVAQGTTKSRIHTAVQFLKKKLT
ncbi:MAG TPA: RNA polymerase subunit sigma [Firmicutes bacterium]|nr:RNA polymerase subunit sigma [Bacillota bacterium]